MLNHGTSLQEHSDGEKFTQRLIRLSTRLPFEVGDIREIMNKESDPVVIMRKNLQATLCNNFVSVGNIHLVTTIYACFFYLETGVFYF